MEKSESPTGRIIVVGSGPIPRYLMQELLRMGHDATLHLSLEISEAEARRHLDRVFAADFAKLEQRALANMGIMSGHNRAASFQAVYGRMPVEDVQPVEKPKKNDPWYRREAKGGKRNRRW